MQNVEFPNSTHTSALATAAPPPSSVRTESVVVVPSFAPRPGNFFFGTRLAFRFVPTSAIETTPKLVPVRLDPAVAFCPVFVPDRDLPVLFPPPPPSSPAAPTSYPSRTRITMLSIFTIPTSAIEHWRYIHRHREYVYTMYGTRTVVHVIHVFSLSLSLSLVRVSVAVTHLLTRD